MHRDIYSGFWFHHYNAVFNKPGEQFYAVGMLASGHFSMKRSLATRENPLFDASLTSREDYDLFLRLEKQGIPSYKDDRILAFIECRRTLIGFLRQRMWYGRGQDQLIAKHGSAFISSMQRRSVVPPVTRYVHLYLILRLTRKVVRWYEAARRRIAGAPGKAQ